MGLLDAAATNFTKTINGKEYSFKRLTLGDVAQLVAKYSAFSKDLLLETLNEEKADKDTRLKALHAHKVNSQFINNISLFAETPEGMLQIILVSLAKTHPEVKVKDVEDWNQKDIADIVITLLEAEPAKPKAGDPGFFTEKK